MYKKYVLLVLSSSLNCDSWIIKGIRLELKIKKNYHSKKNG